MFDFTGFGSIFSFATKIIDKIFPDKDQADKVKLEMLKLQQEGALKELEMEYQNALKQTEVNVEEAKSEKWWKAGARPFIMWVCGVAIAYNYVIMPFIVYFVKVFYPEAPAMPALDTSELMTLLLGMLGLAGMRSYDKSKVG